MILVALARAVQVAEEEPRGTVVQPTPEVV